MTLKITEQHIYNDSADRGQHFSFYCLSASTLFILCATSTSGITKLRNSAEDNKIKTKDENINQWDNITLHIRYVKYSEHKCPDINACTHQISGAWWRAASSLWSLYLRKKWQEISVWNLCKINNTHWIQSGAG